MPCMHMHDHLICTAMCNSAHPAANHLHLHSTLAEVAARPQVTETRRRCMPMGGTLDIWVLMAILITNLFAAAIGLKRIIESGSIIDFQDRDSILWIGIVFALVDSVPALLFAGCALPARPHACSVSLALLRGAQEHSAGSRACTRVCSCTELLHTSQSAELPSAQWPKSVLACTPAHADIDVHHIDNHNNVCAIAGT